MSGTNEKSNDVGLELIELGPSEETLEDGWFGERRSSTSTLPPARRSSVPPIGDSDVDRWLR